MPRCVTDVDMEQGVGRTFLYAAATGGPDVNVLTRKHISLFTFARDEKERWIATGESTMFGRYMSCDVVNRGLSLTFEGCW